MMVSRMRMAGAGVGSSPRKAIILRQIRSLEKQRRELQKKLGGGDSERSSSSQYGGSASTASALAAAFLAAREGEGASAFSGTATGLLAGAAGGGAGFELCQEMDATDILKLIQLIDIQINALIQQLGDDAISVLTAGDDEGDGVFGGVGGPGLLQTGAATSGAAVASGPGGLDEYA